MRKGCALILAALMLLTSLNLACAGAEPLQWDFADGLGDWTVEGCWAYDAGFSLENVKYDAGRQAMHLTGLAFDPAVSWSEIKLNVPVSVGELTAYGRFTLDLRVQTAQLEKGGKELLVQPTAIMADSTYHALTSGGPTSAEAADDGTTLLHYALNFASDLSPISIAVGIVGANTDYQGDMWLEDASLTEIPSDEAIGVEPTVEPINGRVAPIIELNASQPLRLVDPNATESTKLMYAYLRGVSESEFMLFGHQNALHHGVTIKTADGTQSDVYNAVGAQPGIVGLDGLSLVGDEGTFEQSVMLAKAAHKQNALLTLSLHMPNFTTGGDFRDVQKGAIRDVLPGGGAHQKLVEYLDIVADFAAACVDENGDAIPMLLRPYHENNGAWFWWGATGGTAEEYQQLYRFTVEYLRDERQVHSFLYAYSPNAEFTGEAHYLERYPGDAYVDVMGLDYYCNNARVSVAPWLNKMLKSCNILAGLAEQHGKIPAICETGVTQSAIGYEGLAPKDNGACVNWYCELLSALEGSPAGRKMAYFLVWANFSETSLWVPYRRVGTATSHECIDDFTRFYNDDHSLFADRVRIMPPREPLTAEAAK